MSMTVRECDCNENEYEAASQQLIIVERHILPGEGNRASAGMNGRCGFSSQRSLSH